MHTITLLQDIHKDKHCYIIGTGLSIKKLTKNSFEPECPIIALNMAGQFIEGLNIPNPIYSMQKDGNGYPIPAGTIVTYRPTIATLLVSQGESFNLYPEYSPRYVFDAKILGPWFSANCALKIAQIFGCKKIIMMGFDSFYGDCRNIYNTGDTHYPEQHVLINELIKKDSLEVTFILEQDNA